MDIDFVALGQRIREARKYRNVTTNALAKQIGVEPESLRHIECASKRPSLQTLFLIAEKLDVSLDYLTGRVSSITDSLMEDSCIAAGLNGKQKAVLKELVENMLPVITNYI